jgi:branched-chain amino acid transport system substrate-binding protein
LIQALAWSVAVAAPPPIRIGATVSLSGKYQEPSAMMREAFKLWAKQVNARGGLLGRPVQLILYDDQSKEEQVRRLYQKLIAADKVDLVFSPYGTPLTLAASEITEKHRFVLVSGGASGEPIWERGYEYVLGVFAPARRYFIGFLDLMARHGLETVNILYENSPFQIRAGLGAKEWASRLGLKVVLCKAYDQGPAELPGLVKEIMAAPAQGLILCSYPNDSYELLRLLKEAPYRPRALAMTVAPAYPNFPEKVGEMSEGVFASSQWEADTRMPFPGTKEFIEDFKNLTHKIPSYHAGSAYAACQIIEKAIKATGSLSQEKIRDYIRSLDTVTIIGRFRVDETGKQIGHNPIIIQWQQGKKEIVYPLNMQTAAPKL